MHIEPFRLNLSKDEVLEIQDRVGQVLLSGALVLGPLTRQFEEEWSDFVGSQYAVAVSSGTAALEILLKINNSAGKLVAVPTNTNFASVAAIISAGGTPVFLDMAPETFMPTEQIVSDAWKHRRFTGLVWVHIGGLIAPEFPPIVEFCKRKGIFLIEDAAHAHGSRLGGRHAGTFGAGGAFAFCTTKVLTTIEGGMVVTNERKIAELAVSYRNQGQDTDFGGAHYHLGSSWRLPETSAVMGLVQLRKIEATLAKRAVVVRRLASALDEIGLPYCDWRHMSSASHYKLIVRHLEPDSPQTIKQRFQSLGVGLGGGVYERPCHLQPVFRHLVEPESRLEGAEYSCPKHICPPVRPDMSDADIETVAAALRACFGRPTPKQPAGRGTLVRT